MKGLKAWQSFWARVMPGASAEEVAKRARKSAGLPAATEELHDFLVELEAQHRDFIFGVIKDTKWPGPEAALRAARRINQVKLYPEPVRRELVAGILRDEQDSGPENQGA